MGTAVLEFPSGICSPVEVGNLGAFFEPSPPSDEILGSKEERLIRGLLDVLETCLLAAISARNVREFQKERAKGWPKYLRGLRALQDTFSNFVPEAAREQISALAEASLESDIQKKGEATFGELLATQASFTLWTIGEIRQLGKEIVGKPVPEVQKKQDHELAAEYQLNSLWAQFHLDCLAAAIKFERPIAEGIRPEICDGLRAAVNAFTIMKDAEALRNQASSVKDTNPVILPWDEEDEQLLKSSMRDINADFSKGS